MSTGRLPSTDGGIQPTVVDAKGDLLVGVAADSVSRLAVGSNDQVLTADSSTATGLKWAAPAGGGLNWSLISSSSPTSGTQVSFTGLAGTYDQLLVVWQNIQMTSFGNDWGIQLNSDTGSNYDYMRIGVQSQEGESGFYNTTGLNTGGVGVYINYSTSTANYSYGWAKITGASKSGKKMVDWFHKSRNTTNTGNTAGFGLSIYNSSSTISSVQVGMLNGTQTYSAGTIYLYGA